MKGQITLKILEKIGNVAVDFSDLMEAILTAGYGASVSRMDRELKTIRKRRDEQALRYQTENHTKQRYYMMLSKLKKDGLIKEDLIDDKKFLTLTAKGLRKLIALRKRHKKQLPSPTYSKINSPGLTIVAFDVPEKERRKRDWLRAVLKSLNFSMIQKSVWIGKTKVPKEFLDDLSHLNIIDFVEVFEISKTGSLRHVI